MSFVHRVLKPWINKNSTCPQCRSSIYEKDLKPVVPILKNIIDKQKIWCNYKENGCEEVVTIEALQRHLEKCSFEPSRAQREKNSRQNIAQGSHSKVENKSRDQGKQNCVKSVHIRSYSGPYFSAFRLNMERYSVSLRILSECGKIQTRMTLNIDTFHAVKTF